MYIISIFSISISISYNHHSDPEQVQRPGLRYLSNCIQGEWARAVRWFWGNGKRSSCRKGKTVYPKNASLSLFCCRQKQKIINSLRQGEHEYFSFFVCRNPVAKLISIYNYQKTRSSSEYKGHKGPHRGTWYKEQGCTMCTWLNWDIVQGDQHTQTLLGSPLTIRPPGRSTWLSTHTGQGLPDPCGHIVRKSSSKFRTKK